MHNRTLNQVTSIVSMLPVHPAVTSITPAPGKPANMADNMRRGRMDGALARCRNVKQNGRIN
ncbi:MAG: hypothetical protein H5U29_00690 [Pusillimonas sp.]|nr:hypothetical protein [Pusillimonas sp.]